MQKLGFIQGNGHLKFSNSISQRSRKASGVQIFPGTLFITNAVPEKVEQESSTRDEENHECCLKIFYVRENDYNLAENAKFWVGSNLNSFANFGPLMTNDGAREIIFAHLVVDPCPHYQPNWH